MPNNEIDSAILILKKNDKILKTLIDRVGQYEPKFHNASIKSLYQIIISQSLSKEASEKIFNRFETLVGIDCVPKQIIALSNSELRKIGLSQQKIKTIKTLSKLVISQKITIEYLIRVSDEDIINSLTSIKGIGIWSAQIFLIFCLKRMDILPLNDVWLSRSIQREYNMTSLPTPSKIERIGQKWKPYRSIAAWYLWKGYSSEARI